MKESLQNMLFNFAKFIDSIKSNKIENKIYNEKIIYLFPKGNIELFFRKYNLMKNIINFDAVFVE